MNADRVAVLSLGDGALKRAGEVLARLDLVRIDVRLSRAAEAHGWTVDTPP